MTQKARLFVALEPPDEVREVLAQWQRAELTDPGLRVVGAEALHFTLAFLGHRPEEEIDAIAAALPGELPAPRLRLVREPVGIPRGKRPRVIAVEAEDEDGRALGLQAAVSENLAEAGFYEPEARPWWPHITVARVRPEARGSRRPALLETPPGPLPEGAEHVFDSVRMSLYRSYLRPQGSEYVSLASLELNPDS
jgi:RNA 2',3'-cyclic 3'-phosphodiesterase